MTRFPIDAPNARVIKTLDTLRTICTQARISREDFLAAYDKS